MAICRNRLTRTQDMALHIPTLLVVSVFIFSLMGLLTFHAWLRERRERPLAYLGGMMLLAAIGMVLVSWRDQGWTSCRRSSATWSCY